MCATPGIPPWSRRSPRSRQPRAQRTLGPGHCFSIRGSATPLGSTATSTGSYFLAPAGFCAQAAGCMEPKAKHLEAERRASSPDPVGGAPLPRTHEEPGARPQGEVAANQPGRCGSPQTSLPGRRDPVTDRWSAKILLGVICLQSRGPPPPLKVAGRGVGPPHCSLGSAGLRPPPAPRPAASAESGSRVTLSTSYSNRAPCINNYVKRFAFLDTGKF